jgi:hypothetical protein
MVLESYTKNKVDSYREKAMWVLADVLDYGGYPGPGRVRSQIVPPTKKILYPPPDS